MIINIRGTSGSGKSTLVRKLMERYEKLAGTNFVKTVFKVPDRKQPIGYLLSGCGPSVAILGHYETACGGCDTINKMDDIFRLVRESHAQGYDVIFEGLLISADVNRTQALHDEDLPLRVVGLDKVPLELCLDSVNQRRHDADEGRRFKADAINTERAAKGLKLKPVPEFRGGVNPKNTTSKFKGVSQSMNRLRAANVVVYSCDREGAFDVICKGLGLKQ